MSKVVRIERLANILAAALTIYWAARGALLLSGGYRDLLAFTLRTFEHGGPGLAAVWRFAAAPFLAIAVLIAARSADPRVHRAQIVLGVFFVGVLTWASPSLWMNALAPMPRAFAAIGGAWALLAMARGDDELWRLEQRLRLVLAAVAVATGVCQLFVVDRAAAEVFLRILPPRFDPLFVVRALGAFNFLFAALVLSTPSHGVVLRTVLRLRIAHTMFVSTAITVFDGWHLYHPAAPLLNDLVMIGLLLAFHHLGRQDDVRYYTALKMAERAERLAARLTKTYAARWAHPFDRVASENAAQSEAVIGMLGSRDLTARMDAAFIHGIAAVISGLLRPLGKGTAVRLAVLAERSTLECYQRCLDVLPERSLSRRTLEELVAAKNRHLRWLRGA